VNAPRSSTLEHAYTKVCPFPHRRFHRLPVYAGASATLSRARSDLLPGGRQNHSAARLPSRARISCAAVDAALHFTGGTCFDFACQRLYCLLLLTCASTLALRFRTFRTYLYPPASHGPSPSPGSFLRTPSHSHLGSSRRFFNATLPCRFSPSLAFTFHQLDWCRGDVPCPMTRAKLLCRH